MCFYHDDNYDWIARVHESDTVTAEKPVKCLECFRVIPPGQKYTHIEMREWECCRVCDPDTREEAEVFGEPPAEPCADDKHDYGETDEHRICEQCQKLLHAIQLVEEDEGCQGNETQPAYGQLREAFWESDGALDCIDRARNEYPELAMSGHLDEFYELTREYDRRFTENEWLTRGESEWDEDDVGPNDEMGGEG